MNDDDLKAMEEKAYQLWVNSCRDTVKTMPDVINLLYALYRNLCYDNNSEHSSFCTMPKELKLSYAGWMLDQVKENVEKWPVDKLHRWIGFVQAILAFHGVITVEEERKRTRPIFHAYYHREGIIPPASVEP